LNNLSSRLAPAVGLVALSLFVGLLQPAFLAPENLKNVVLQSAINGVLAVGMTLVILTGGIDLSVGSILALSGVVLGSHLAAGQTSFTAIPLCLAVGTACGLVNGLLITRGDLPPFIATLGTMSAARGIALVYSGGRPVSGFGERFLSLASAPVLILAMAAVFAVAYVVLTQTVFGRALYAVGGNERASWLAGLRVNQVKLGVYGASGFLAALASVLLTARLNSAQPIAGMMYELDAIAAVVIGGTSLTGGQGGVLGTLIGVLIMGVLRNGLNLLEVSSDTQQVVIGAVIVIAVLVDRGRARFVSWMERGGAPRRRVVLTAVAASLAVVLMGAWLARPTVTGRQATFALILKTLNNPFWVDVAEAAQEAANKAGVRLIVLAPERETDVEKQMQIVENVILKKVDAILLAPSGSKEIVPAIRKANDAGIPVLLVDTRVDEAASKSAGAHVETFIGSDNLQGGRLAGEAMVAALSGKGRVIVLEGITGHETTDARKQGFGESVKNAPGMEIAASQTANCEQEKAFNVTQNLLQADPNIQGIFACNDVMAMGAVQALKAMGRKDILVVGFDASADARKAIGAGDMLGSVAQYPREMGRIGVERAQAVLNGEKLAPYIPTKVDVVKK